MTLPTRSDDTPLDIHTEAFQPEVSLEKDSIPRIKIRDLMIGVQFLGRNPGATLDALRVKLNSDRNASSGGTAGYAIARDVAAELGKLKYASVGPLPKDSKGFE